MPQRTPPAAASALPANRQQGSLAVYLAVALVSFGLLAMVGVTRFGASVTSVLSPNCSTAARYMAEAGLRYARARLRACTTVAQYNTVKAALNGATFTMDAGRGLSFTLAITEDANYTATVTSTGKGCSVIAPVTNQMIDSAVNLPVVAASNAVDPTTVSVTFAGNLNEFSIAATGTSGSITKNTVTGAITFGNNVLSAQSAAWFTGTNPLCTNGACTLGNGLCAYYRVQFNPNGDDYTKWETDNNGDYGDGFVWTIMNAATNTAASYGGGGENMGYSGATVVNSTTMSILPPKLGTEFDVTRNWKHCGQLCQLDNNGNYVDNIACDASAADHMAFLFWGLKTLSCISTRDDHIHGAGAGTDEEPYNSYNFDGAMDGWDGYYARSSSAWLFGNRTSPGAQYLVRYELDRSTTPNAQGNYVYRERTWVVTSGDTYSATISNCAATHADTPTMSRTFALSPSMHAQLSKIYFGWTMGTGAYADVVKIDKFALNFKAAPSATAPTVPTGYAAAYTFDEAANATIHDTSGNGNNGTKSGAAMWGPDVRTPKSASMFFTTAGTDGLVTVNDAASLRLDSGAGTIAAWVNVRKTGSSNAPLVSKSGAYILRFNTGRTLSLVLTNGGTTTVTTTTTLPSNSKWYHVAATWNGTKAIIYINGTAMQTTTTTRTAASTTTPLLIGGNGSISFDGLIDDLYLYNRALTATEITGLASGTHY